jgi:hypothetical protein
LRLGKVILGVLAVNGQQVYSRRLRNGQVDYPASTAFAFSTRRFLDTHFPQAASTVHDSAFLGVSRQFVLKRTIGFVVQQFPKTFCERLRLNKQHARLSYSVGYHIPDLSGNRP